MSKRLLSLIVLFTFIFTFVFGEYVMVFAQDEQVRIAILPFTDTNAAASQSGYGQAVSGMLMTELINNPMFQVVERNQIDQMMQEMAFQYSGAVDSQTAKKIGAVLGVDILVFGTVSKFTSQIETDIRLVDAESGEALMAENANCNDEVELRAMTGELALKINDRFQQRFEETVNIYSDPYGAAISIDGVDSGVTPLSVKLSRGSHTVVVSMDGYADWQQQIDVIPGDNHIDVYLESGSSSVKSVDESKEKKGGKILYWLIGGAAVAAGTVFLLNSNKSDDPEQQNNNSNVTITTTLP